MYNEEKRNKVLKNSNQFLYGSCWVEMFGNRSCVDILYIVTDAFV